MYKIRIALQENDFATRHTHSVLPSYEISFFEKIQIVISDWTKD